MNLTQVLLVLSLVLLSVCRVTAVHYDEYMKDTWHRKFQGRPSKIEVSDDQQHTVIYSKDNVLGVVSNSVEYNFSEDSAPENIVWRHVLPSSERSRDMALMDSKLVFSLSTVGEASIVRGFSFAGDVLFESRVNETLTELMMLGKTVVAYNEEKAVFFSVLSGDIVQNMDVSGKLLHAVVLGDSYQISVVDTTENVLRQLTIPLDFSIIRTKDLALAVPRAAVLVHKEGASIYFVQYSSGTGYFTKSVYEPWKSQVGFPYLDMMAGTAGTVQLSQLSEHSSEVVINRTWPVINNNKLSFSPTLHTVCRGQNQLEVYGLPSEHKVDLVFPSFTATLKNTDGQPISCVERGNIAVVVLSTRVVVAVNLDTHKLLWARAEFLGNSRIAATGKATVFAISQHTVSSIDTRNGRVRWSRFLPSRSPALLHQDSSVIRDINETEDSELVARAQQLSFQPLLSVVGDFLCVTQGYPPSLKRNYVLKDTVKHLSTTSYIACFTKKNGKHVALPQYSEVQRYQQHSVEQALQTYQPYAVQYDGVPLAQQQISTHTTVLLLTTADKENNLLPSTQTLSTVTLNQQQPVYVTYLHAGHSLYTYKIYQGLVKTLIMKPVGAGVHVQTQNVGRKPIDTVVPIGTTRFMKAGSNAHMVLATELDGSVELHIFNGITGVAVESLTFANAVKPLVAMHDNRVICTYFDTKYLHQIITVVMLVSTIPTTNIFGKKTSDAQLFTLNQSYILPLAPTHIGFTISERDLNNVDLIVATADGSVWNIPQMLLDSRRTMQREEDSIPYSTYIYLTPQHLLSQNLTLHGVQQLRSEPGDFESQGLVVACGMDWFATTVYPSGKFDSLSEDFSKPLLLLTVSVVLVITIIAKFYAEQQKLVKKWK